MTMSQGMSSTQVNYSDDDSADFQKHDIAALNSQYMDGESCDGDVFSEMRTNVLLVAGEHYNRRQSRFYKRIRDSKELSQEQKLRLTKNHVRKICQIYANNIISMNPGVGFSPKDENNMHDQKVADLHHSVWRDAYDRYYLEDKVDDWCDSFVQLGEVAVKIFYDPSLGDVKGYEPQTDPETGSPFMNEFQQAIPDTSKPIMSGEFVFEEIYGFNLLRPAECKDMRKAEWICIRKMTSRDEMLRRFKSNPEIKKLLVSQEDETYAVFDSARGGYKKTSKQLMLREFYFRPCLMYPEGYFYITTKEGILAEGPLPGGLFPIVFMPFDKIQTTPRGRSPVKQMRPYQAEINRSASKIAEHQITLGDDKLLQQNGTKISAGISLPGIRTVNYTGTEPKILEGRNGAQYLEYMTSQITELYGVMNVSEDSETDTPNLDPYVLLFRSAKQKKKFQRYIKRFEKFLVEIVRLYLRLAKIHLPDDAVIMAIGKNEQVNIEEFRQLAEVCYEVKIEAQADDIETKLGKQIVLNHALQYIGPQLKPEQIGKIMRQMPFANDKESFEDLTIDEDCAVNDMLSLDRNEQPPVNQYDNHVYMIKRLTARTRKPDFRFLPDPVKQNYSAKINIHQQFEAQNQLAIQRAEQGMIPTGGPLAVVDLYVKDPSDPTGTKTQRARLPMAALQWLTEQLAAQGNSQAMYGGMGSGELAGIANKFSAGQGGQSPSPGSPNPGPGMAHPMARPPMGMVPPARPPMGQPPMRPNGIGSPWAHMGNAMPGMR